MKQFILVIILLTIFLLSGCIANDYQNPDTPDLVPQDNIILLSEENALEIASLAHQKFTSVFYGGEGIPGNVFDKTDPLDIDGQIYYYFGSSLDQFDKFDAYLRDVFTDKSISKIKDCLKVSEYEGSLIGYWGEAGSELSWKDASVASLKLDNNMAEAVIIVPLYIDNAIDRFEINMEFIYFSTTGWRVDVEDPEELL